ncbi:MAG: alpha/beta hydrolase family protein [Pirellulaceae bacterium]
MKTRTNRFVVLMFAAAFLFLGSGIATPRLLAQSSYEEPPQAVVDIIDAKPVPSVSFSPDRQWMLMIGRSAMPSIEDLSRRMLRLAGMRIDPVANSRFSTRFYSSLALRAVDGETAIEIPIPDDVRVSGVSWSHHSNYFAITTVTEEGQQVWVVSIDAPSEPKMVTDRLSTVMGRFDWMPDGESILCQLVPSDRGAEPESSTAPTGPNVQESSGNTSPTRTYQDLLSNPDDEALFEYFAKNQLARISLTGEVQEISEPAIFSGVAPSPDGNHILVTRIEKPFSYLMTMRSFPQKIEVWNVEGKREFLVADVPMAENIPIEGVRVGRRNVDWKSGESATLVWAEALDGGDPNVEAKFRDQLVTVSAPFSASPEPLLKTTHRASGLSVMQDSSLVTVTDYDRDRRWIQMKLYDVSNPDTAPIVMMDRSIRDRYNDPGSIVMVPDETGHVRALQDGEWIYRTGSGASSKGNLPFIDRQNLETLETERLWRCEEGVYESVVAIAAHKEGRKPTIVISSEDPITPPNYFSVDLESGDRKALTEFRDPTPQIRGIKKQLVKYEREDGVPLSATLYLPANYKKGERLPLLVWAYPREFSDARTAGQISGSPSQFTRMSGITHLTFLTQGYAIMNNATMPVIGDPETMNDTFIEQIVGAAQAAIDKAVDMGVADRNRVGVGGHSYGAFMTANLLAHCDLFSAGIARSGAYNRTLTPFGFQSERRPFWEAKDVYMQISPFMHANKINEPMLMVHGEADNNSGTFPIQSKRMYQAIKGNGGTVRLVMLPNESHGYQARESVLHTQAEMIDWFDKHVKNADATH